MAKKKNNKPMLSSATKLGMIALLIPIAITVYVLTFFAWKELQTLPIFEKLAQQKAIEEIQQHLYHGHYLLRIIGLKHDFLR